MALDAQGPFNYNTIADTQAVSPMQAFSGGVQSGQQDVEGALKLQSEAVGIAQGQQMQRDVAAVGANPTATGLSGLAIKYPQLADKFKAASDMMTTQQREASLQQAIPIYAAIQSGNPETAAKLLDQQADGYKNAGNVQGAQSAQTMAVLVRQHPDQAKTLMAFPLIGAVGPEKFAEMFKTAGEESRANAKAPGEVAKINADAAEASAKAAAAPQTVALDNQKKATDIANVAAQNKLERDRLTSDTQYKMLELNQKYGAPEGANYTTVKDGVEKSIQASGDAARFEDFANQYEKIGSQSGGKGWIAAGLGHAPATWQEGYKYVTGNQDAITDIRNQYNIMRTKGLVANLPPQVTRLTDSDLKVFNAGIPSENADPARAAAFLRSMALVKHVESTTEDVKAQWAAANRSLANAKQDIDINGVKAAAGTPLKKFMDDYLAQDVRNYKQSLSNNKVGTRDYAPYLQPAQPVQPQPQQTDEALARDALRNGQGY